MSYFAPKTEARKETVINKSRFIGIIFPVNNEREAEHLIKKIETEFQDATHCCYAFIIEGNTSAQRFSDAGEPSGTAGKPILEILKKKGLKNTLLVVVRYFGGIKLGAGGLVRAYSNSAVAAIDCAVISEYTPASLFQIDVDYKTLNPLIALVNSKGGIITETLYNENITLKFAIKSAEADAVVSAVTNLTNGTPPALILETFLCFES